MQLHRITQTVVGLLCFLCLTMNAVAEASWEEEFQTLCGATSEAQGYSLTELYDLVERCDNLLKRIEKSPSQQKKVAMLRLSRCRNYFAYLAEVKEEKQKAQ